MIDCVSKWTEGKFLKVTVWQNLSSYLFFLFELALIIKKKSWKLKDLLRIHHFFVTISYDQILPMSHMVNNSWLSNVTATWLYPIHCHLRAFKISKTTLQGVAENYKVYFKIASNFINSSLELSKEIQFQHYLMFVVVRQSLF